MLLPGEPFRLSVCLSVLPSSWFQTEIFVQRMRYLEFMHTAGHSEATFSGFYGHFKSRMSFASSPGIDPATFWIFFTPSQTCTRKNLPIIPCVPSPLSSCAVIGRHMSGRRSHLVRSRPSGLTCSAALLKADLLLF